MADSEVAADELETDESSNAGGNGRFHVKERSFHFSKLSEHINGPRGISCSAGMVLVEVELLVVVVVVVVIVVNELACCGEGECV